MFDEQPERIVCAAVRQGETVICGVRHFDKFMQQHLPHVRWTLRLQRWHLYRLLGWAVRRKSNSKWECGFVTNKMRFVPRREAWDIAVKNDQICWGKDREAGQLFSEDLY